MSEGFVIPDFFCALHFFFPLFFSNNTDRLIREKQWKEEMEHAEKVWYNKYFRHTRPYRWFSNKWYRAFNALGHFCNKVAMWV